VFLNFFFLLLFIWWRIPGERRKEVVLSESKSKSTFFSLTVSFTTLLFLLFCQPIPNTSQTTTLSLLLTRTFFSIFSSILISFSSASNLIFNPSLLHSLPVSENHTLTLHKDNNFPFKSSHFQPNETQFNSCLTPFVQVPGELQVIH